MKLLNIKRLQNALRLREPRRERKGAIREGNNGGARGVPAEKACNEGLRRGVREAMSVEDNEGGDGARGSTGEEEVSDEDAGGDEKGSATGV